MTCMCLKFYQQIDGYKISFTYFPHILNSQTSLC